MIEQHPEMRSTEELQLLASDGVMQPCRIEWMDRCVHWIFQGPLTASSVIETFGELYGHARFDETRVQIRNYSAITSYEISVADVQKIAAFDRAASKSNPNMKIALVVSTENENHEALAYLYDAELYDTPWQVAVFSSLEAALEWAA